MIEQRAVVKKVDHGYVWVEIQRQSACGACHVAEAGCATSTLAKIWPSQPVQIQALAKIAVQPGDTVVVGLAEGSLLRGALLTYLLPLIALFAAALGTQAVVGSAGEEPVVLAGAVGLGLGFLMVRILSRRLRDDARFQPVLLRRAEVTPSAINVLSLP